MCGIVAEDFKKRATRELKISKNVSLGSGTFSEMIDAALQQKAPTHE